MSKGLEALSKIKSDHEIILFGFSTCDYEYAKEFDIIEKELEEHEQHKAIENELGIDLVTLFKALKDGVYYLNKQKELHWCQARNLVISQKSIRVYRHHYKLFKDYGKTWALTKEELL